MLGGSPGGDGCHSLDDREPQMNTGLITTLSAASGLPACSLALIMIFLSSVNDSTSPAPEPGSLLPHILGDVLISCLCVFTVCQ